MHQRILISEDPLLDLKTYRFETSPWPALWIGPVKHEVATSQVLAFRCQFDIAKARTARIHVSADQRYELYVDGQRLGRGPGGGDLLNWSYDSYLLDFAAGAHTLVARVWWIAPSAPAPVAQLTVRPGFILLAEGDANDWLSTGVAPWQYRTLGGYRFVDKPRHQSFFADGAVLSIDAARLTRNFERGTGSGWRLPQVVGKAALAAAVMESQAYWLLRPSQLPPMHERVLNVGVARQVEQPPSGLTHTLRVTAANNLRSEQRQWDALLKGRHSLRIPARTRRRVIIDLQNYYCAYPLIRVNGGQGALIRAQFAEALYYWPDPAQDPRNCGNPKGNRDEIEGKIFFGSGGELRADGRPALFESHQWMAGRYLEVYVQTAGAPLTIEALQIEETHYPYSFKHRFTSDDQGLNGVIPIALRTLEMCSHQTSMDCPYYERLNYVGDTRLQALVAYAADGDERLARLGLQLFDWSRQTSGLTRSRHPSHIVQTIPTFSLWWIAMIHDFARWRRDRDFVSERMRGARAVLEYWRSRRSDNGLLLAPPGWNFVDWVPAWPKGIAPDGEGGFSGVVNLQAVLVFGLAAELEEYLGETALAQRNRDFARSLFASIKSHYYVAGKGLFADDLAHTRFSEHAQCLAVLTGRLSAAQNRRLMKTMLETTGLAVTTIYFSHYLFEALRQVGRIDKVMQRLDLWRDLERQGFKTAFESPEPTRSDCHAWAAHPVFHYHASVAGIRPADWSFAKVRIEPQLGHLNTLQGRMPHPAGFIDYDYCRVKDRITGRITLPGTLQGELVIGTASQMLKPGPNIIRI
jgi:alpha-L-rhamnosidase